MSRILRFELTAARRGNFRRGDVVTLPFGSPEAARYQKDPAWRCSEGRGTVAKAAPEPRPVNAAEDAFQALMAALEARAAAVRRMHPDDRALLVEVCEQRQRVLFRALSLAAGVPIEEIEARLQEQDPVPAPDAPPAPDGDAAPETEDLDQVAEVAVEAPAAPPVPVEPPQAAPAPRKGRGGRSKSNDAGAAGDVTEKPSPAELAD